MGISIKVAPATVMLIMAFVNRVRPFNFFWLIIESQGKITAKFIGWSRPEIEIDNLKSTRISKRQGI